MIEIRRVTGKAVLPYLSEVAALRIRVFREFPYLYDGTEGYERDYLETYAESARSVFVLAFDGEKVVGASTGLPLEEADEAFLRPFAEAGIERRDVFYFGESVLATSYRGQGIGHRFFDERESYVLELGFSTTAFCSVVREPGHPLCPENYRSNDAFWTKRGYRKAADLKALLGWKQIDRTDPEVLNSLVFWIKQRP